MNASEHSDQITDLFHYMSNLYEHAAMISFKYVYILCRFGSKEISDRTVFSIILLTDNELDPYR